jgi:hypothetical protein
VVAYGSTTESRQFIRYINDLALHAATMFKLERRYTDPYRIIANNEEQDLPHGDTAQSQHRNLPVPATALCPTCRILFYRPEKCLKDSVRAIVFKEPSAKDIARCCVCQSLDRLDDGGEMHPLQLGWKLLLRQEDSQDGSLDLMSQHADQGENDGSWKAMKFFRSVADSNEPQFEYNTRFPNAGDRRTVPVCPTIPESFEDERCFSQIQKWIQQCTEKHTLCRGQIDHTSNLSLPTRLLYIRNGLRLVDTSAECFKYVDVKYATLSHRWTQNDSIKLLRRNLTLFQQAIREDHLPPVFADTVNVARRLNIDYVWIDALAIIQDDPEDWAREASRMGSVYAHAYCNFGGSGAARSVDRDDTDIDTESSESEESNVDPGLFAARDHSVSSMAHISVVRRKYDRAYYGFSHGQCPGLKYDVLMDRGWVRSPRYEVLLGFKAVLRVLVEQAILTCHSTFPASRQAICNQVRKVHMAAYTNCVAPEGYSKNVC